MIEVCACGHLIEEHGGDPEYPGSSKCHLCDCCAYEADEDSSGEIAEVK